MNKLAAKAEMAVRKSRYRKDPEKEFLEVLKKHKGISFLGNESERKKVLKWLKKSIKRNEDRRRGEHLKEMVHLEARRKRYCRF